MENNHPDSTQDKLNADYLHSAFFINAAGEEIAITREMIVQSCEQIAMAMPTQSKT
jgi:hypothetical protein